MTDCGAWWCVMWSASWVALLNDWRQILQWMEPMGAEKCTWSRWRFNLSINQEFYFIFSYMCSSMLCPMWYRFDTKTETWKGAFAADSIDQSRQQVMRHVISQVGGALEWLTTDLAMDSSRGKMDVINIVFQSDKQKFYYLSILLVHLHSSNKRIYRYRYQRKY